jgi:undecaprenyl-diphosphatase
MMKQKQTLQAAIGRLETTLSTLDESEFHWCRRFNSCLNHRGVKTLFAIISRIGDGVVWYLTMLLLPLIWGKAAFVVVLKMLLVGVVGLCIYKKLKHRTRRSRPCHRHTGIAHPVKPLDEYSFPSGHTLHAVGFTVVVGAHYPVLLWLFFPLTVLIALSRVVLGLHYPSDVLAGALIGWSVAMLVVLIQLT